MDFKGHSSLHLDKFFMKLNVILLKCDCTKVDIGYAHSFLIYQSSNGVAAQIDLKFILYSMYVLNSMCTLLYRLTK